MGESKRALVAQALVSIVEQAQTLDNVLLDMRPRAGSAAEAAYLQECLYGVLRRYFTLAERLDGYLGKPLKAREAPIRMLLLSALYELSSMSTPPYAVVNESVLACDALGRSWAKPLVNAILRRALRETSLGAARESLPLEALYDHPQWLISSLQQDWPADWQQVLEANNARAPLTLRVNQRRTSRAAYLARLAALNIAAQPTEHSDLGVTLEIPRPITEIPGFSAGEISVQDEAAQLAAPLLACLPDHRVLDACAAPGGKTAHLLEQTPHLDLLATDISGKRLSDVKSNLLRLGLACQLEVCDVRKPGHGGPDVVETFDRILLDAPCSATGVIRRHPDIKLHRSPEDVTTSAARQFELLMAMWLLLKPGGRMVYATCSVLQVENDTVLARFLSISGPTATVEPVRAAWGRPTRYGRQILPGNAAMDGFYYAVIEKMASHPA